MDSGVLVERYVRALSGAELDSKRLTSLAEELSRLAQLYEDCRDFELVLENPVFDYDDRKRVLDIVLNRISASTTCRNTLYVLLDKDRISLLPAIARGLERRVDIMAGVIHASLTVAVAPSKAELKRISQVLSEQSGRPVKLSVRLDPEVIGGALVEMGGQVYDGTVKHLLDDISELFRKEAR